MTRWMLCLCTFFMTVNVWGIELRSDGDANVAINSLKQSLQHSFKQAAPSDWGAILSVGLKRFAPHSKWSAILYYEMLALGQRNPRALKLLKQISKSDEDLEKFETYLNRLAVGQIKMLVSDSDIRIQEAYVALHSLKQSLSYQFTGVTLGDWGSTISGQIKRFEPDSEQAAIVYYSALAFNFSPSLSSLDERHTDYMSRFAFSVLSRAFETSICESSVQH